MSLVMFFPLLLIIDFSSLSPSHGLGPPSSPKGPGPGASGSKGPGLGPPKPGPGPSSDPNTIYKSFLECLLTQSPQPDPSFPSIVYSSAANSSAYTKTLQDRIKNRRYSVTSTPRPAITVTPIKESHVQAAVLCAKKLGVQIKIRSGRHDYEAVSYVSSEKSFMVLDMFNFRAVDVNITAETAVVQVGAQLGDLYYRIWEKSKVHGCPAGACPTVGAGGCW